MPSQPRKETALCPWCESDVFKVGICLVGGEPVDTCNAWRCDTCDTYLDCLGMPITFENVIFVIPGIQHCRFSAN